MTEFVMEMNAIKKDR